MLCCRLLSERFCKDKMRISDIGWFNTCLCLSVVHWLCTKQHALLVICHRLHEITVYCLFFIIHTDFVVLLRHSSCFLQIDCVANDIAIMSRRYALCVLQFLSFI